MYSPSLHIPVSAESLLPRFFLVCEIRQEERKKIEIGGGDRGGRSCVLGPTGFVGYRKTPIRLITVGVNDSYPVRRRRYTSGVPGRVDERGRVSD